VPVRAAAHQKGTARDGTEVVERLRGWIERLSRTTGMQSHFLLV
jgi:hypothetical protein